MDTNTPLIFSDGTVFSEELSKKYISHTQGYLSLAPSGAGKTYFVNNQTENHWIDGDTLWPLANADKTDSGWVSSNELVMEINNKCDVITHEARKLGFWVLGSSNHFLKPDAIVLPDWDIHKEYVAKREEYNYDGGAKNSDLDELQAHRAWIKKWEDQGVPCFDSISAAAEYLANKSRNVG